MAEQLISRVVNGATVRGTYTVKDGILTLKTGFGTKTAKLGSWKPASLAYVILRELCEGAPELPPTAADGQAS
jgi:hypothetical protein